MASREQSGGLAELALGELHERLGARFVEERGVAVPVDYGEPAAELAALHDGCGVGDLSFLDRLELRGRDRHRFLNGLVTSNVKDLSAGCGLYGFLLEKQGKVLADVYVTALEDRLWLELPAGTGDRVRRHLEGYRVIDDVEVASLDDLALLSVLGPAAARVLGETAAALGADQTARVSIEGCEVQLTHRRVWGVDGFVLWAPSSLAEEIFAGLVDVGRAGAAEPTMTRAVGLGALEATRIETGFGRWGVDYGEDAVANETGLVDLAVDFTKGCYLGQEIVARIHYRGKPSVLLCPLCISGRSEAPRLPATVLSVPDAGGGSGEAVGRLTSAVASGSPGSWLAIGTLSRRALDAGSPLVLEGGGDVALRERAG